MHQHIAVEYSSYDRTINHIVFFKCNMVIAICIEYCFTASDCALLQLEEVLCLTFREEMTNVDIQVDSTLSLPCFTCRGGVVSLPRPCSGYTARCHSLNTALVPHIIAVE